MDNGARTTDRIQSRRADGHTIYASDPMTKVVTIMTYVQNILQFAHHWISFTHQLQNTRCRVLMDLETLFSLFYINLNCIDILLATNYYIVLLLD